jgi:trans-aconitate methyltransferase
MILYKDRYEKQFATEMEWLERNAIERVDSIQALLANQTLTPRRIVELGCGPGALLSELRRRSIGETYTGIDYSQEAIAYLKDTMPDIEAFQADVTSPDFVPDKTFDLVLLIHVLQHLQDPGKCLDAISKKMRFSHLIIEVPLEDSLLAKMLRPFQRHNVTQEIRQTFSLRSFKQLLAARGLSIVDEKRYAPVYALQTLRVQRVRQRWSTPQYFKKLLTSHYIPKFLGPLKTRIHYSQYVVLCKRA